MKHYEKYTIKNSTFYFKPFAIIDLTKPHFKKDENIFLIEKIIELKKIDYENFSTDLCVDRWFIEDNADLLRIVNDVWHCIFVHQVGCTSGILVMSDGYAYPRWAACYDEAGL